MLKLTKTGIGLLTKQYRSVLRKCFFLNLGLFIFTSLLVTMAPNISLASDLGDAIQTGPLSSINWGAFSGGGYSNIYRWDNSYFGGFAMATGYTPGIPEPQLNLQIDGYFYQNEGYYRVLDTSNISNAINSTSTSTVASSAAVNAVRELVPTNTNQLTNGAGFITKSVSDLTNYYTKSETYSRNEIANLDSLNYYYTFRNDKTIETAEFALFLDNEKLSNMLDV